MRRKLNILGTLGIMASISYLSLSNISSPGGTGGSLLPLIFHFSAYFVLAGSIATILNESERGYLKAALGSFLFGLLMELGQTQVPGRTYSNFDVFLNTAGAFLILLDGRIGVVTTFLKIEDRIIGWTGWS